LAIGDYSNSFSLDVQVKAATSKQLKPPIQAILNDPSERWRMGKECEAG
jgi:hypothetical protein